MYKGTKRAAQRMSRPCVIEITALNDHTSVAIYRLYFYAISELRLQRYNKLINCARKKANKCHLCEFGTNGICFRELH
jgi:hypothetical protein